MTERLSFSDVEPGISRVSVQIPITVDDMGRQALDSADKLSEKRSIVLHGFKFEICL